MRASRGGSIWRMVLEVEHAVVGDGMVASGGI